jgi:hypothetical protein
MLVGRTSQCLLLLKALAIGGHHRVSRRGNTVGPKTGARRFRHVGFSVHQALPPQRREAPRRGANDLANHTVRCPHFERLQHDEVFLDRGLCDEALLLGVGARDVQRQNFTLSGGSIELLDAELRYEDSSTLNVEEHPERGDEMYHATHRDEFDEGILRKRLCEVPPRNRPIPRSRVPQIGDSPYVGSAPSWEADTCRLRVVMATCRYGGW